MCILALFFRRYIGAFFSNEQGGHETLGIFSLFKRFFFALRFKGEGAIFYLRFSPFSRIFTRDLFLSLFPFGIPFWEDRATKGGRLFFSFKARPADERRSFFAALIYRLVLPSLFYARSAAAAEQEGGRQGGDKLDLSKPNSPTLHA